MHPGPCVRHTTISSVLGQVSLGFPPFPPVLPLGTRLLRGLIFASLGATGSHSRYFICCLDPAGPSPHVAQVSPALQRAPCKGHATGTQRKAPFHLGHWETASVVLHTPPGPRRTWKHDSCSASKRDLTVDLAPGLPGAQVKYSTLFSHTCFNLSVNPAGSNFINASRAHPSSSHHGLTPPL